MKIKSMMKLDRILGIPLCLFLSILNFILGSKKADQISQSGKKNILFVKLSEMGAIVLAYPLLHMVKEKYPRSDLYFLTFKKNKSFFDVLDGVIPRENIFTIRDDSFWNFTVDSISAAIKIRKKKIDLTYDLEMMARFSAIFTFVSGAKKRIGFHPYTFEGLYRGNLMTHRVQFNPLLHMSKSYLSLGKAAEGSSKLTPDFEEKIKDEEIMLPKYAPSEKTEESVMKKLEKSGLAADKKIILINPGEGTLPLRDWPLDNFVGLAKKILAREEFVLVIIGTPSESLRAEKLCHAVGSPRCIDLTGQTSLSELLELMTMSKALIANDCGLAHFTALTDIKKFIIFGPESPQIFGPLGGNNFIIYSDWPCSPCFSVFNHRNSACRNNMCLKSISVDLVYDRFSKNI